MYIRENGNETDGMHIYKYENKVYREWFYL